MVKFHSKNSRLDQDFGISASFVFALCFFFESQWETNDDIGVPMVAHGYGIAAVGMPNFIFQCCLGLLGSIKFANKWRLGSSMAIIVVLSCSLSGPLFFLGAFIISKTVGEYSSSGVYWLSWAKKYGQLVVSWRECEIKVAQ